MYKDGFELWEGDYFWARFGNWENPVIVKFDDELLGHFSVCGSDENVHDFEITLLKKVTYD